MLCFVTSFPPLAKASMSECQEAIDSYNSATSDLSSAIQAYAECISESEGHDDCDSEFLRVSTAQSDFEDAVQSYETNCGP
jgi:hypothetical protein